MTQSKIGLSQELLKAIGMVENAISNSPNGVSFCSIRNYRNQKGELANYLFNIGVDYATAKKKDIEFLKELDVTKGQWNSPMKLMLEAQVALIKDYTNPSKPRSEGQTNAYYKINDGLKVHIETGEILVYGMKVNKTKLEEGDYGADTRFAMTKAKDELRKLLKHTKYRQFIFQPIGMKFKASGDEITFEGKDE